jgi:hypothetical protein
MRARPSWAQVLLPSSGIAPEGFDGWLRLADAAFRHVIADARIDDGSARGFIHGGRDFCHCVAVRLKEHQVRGPCCTEQEPSNNHQNLSGIHHTC